MRKYLEIGKIVNTRGIKGEIKVVPLTDDPKRYKQLKWVYIDKNGELARYNIQKVSFLTSFVRIKFWEVNDISEAEKLKGFFIKVDREHAVRLPEHAYFICDIIHCSVFTEDDEKIGQVIDVIRTGSNDVYVARNEDKNGKDILIPALKSVVKNVEVESGKIIVKLPEGLIDDEI